MKTAEARARRMKEGTDRRRGEIPSFLFPSAHLERDPPRLLLPPGPLDVFSIFRPFLLSFRELFHSSPFIPLPSIPPYALFLPLALSLALSLFSFYSTFFHLVLQSPNSTKRSLPLSLSFSFSFPVAFLRSFATHSRTLPRHHHNNELYRYEYRGTRAMRESWILKMTQLLQDEKPIE